MPKSAFDLDEGIENIPVVKAPVQAVNKVANSGTKYAVKQAKALTKAFVSQLYGSSTGTSVTATDDDQQQSDATAADPLAQIKKTQANPAAAGVTVTPQVAKSHGTTTTGANSTNNTKTPEEEELEETRRALRQHVSEYQVPTFGKIDDVEMDVKKEAQKRKQEAQKKEQEEEQEKQRKAEEAKKQGQQLEMPRGRVRGQPPGVLKRSQTKTENKTGFSG